MAESSTERERWKILMQLLGSHDRENGRRDEELKTLLSRIDDLEREVRDIPAQTLAYTEQAVYRLRIARHEALQAGVSEPAPLPPPPSGGPYRELAPVEHDETKPFALQHTDGTRRHLMEVLGESTWWVLKKGWPFLLAAASAAVTHFAHH